jgi:hypothetical protein
MGIYKQLVQEYEIKWWTLFIEPGRMMKQTKNQDGAELCQAQAKLV